MNSGWNQYIAGHDLPPSRKFYRQCALRINSIVLGYHQRPLKEYLRGIAYNFSLKV